MTVAASTPSPAAPERAAGLGPWLFEARAMVKLALPLIAGQLGLIAMSVTDVLMIAPLGPTHLAAGSLAFMLYFNIWLFCLGVLIASASLASQARGARNFKGVRRSIRQGFWVAITLVPPAALALWFGGDLLLLTGQDPKVVALAEPYLRAIVWSLPFSFGFLVLRFFVSALSRPNTVMIGLIAGAVVNVPLDYLLIHGALGVPALGIAGAAWATSLIWVGLFAWLVAVVLRDREFRRYHVFVRFWRPDWQRYREIWRIGLPVGVTLIAESGLFGACQLLMGLIGTLELAAHAVAIQVASVAFMVPLGIGQAAQVRVGQRFGAGDRAGVRRAGWMAMLLAGVTTGAAALVMWFAPEAIVGLFLESGSPIDGPVFVLAVNFLLVAAVFQLVDGAQVAMVSSLRGLSDTAWPLVIAVLSYWVVGFGAAWVFAFPLGLDGVGVWMGLAVGLAAAAVGLTLRFVLRERLGLLDRPAAA
ncbi:MATE family efflux transporter [Algihabitans albus]|uniref:MATE family efflux transporter n=1 Tax=Algihabitans albus TaxID=2164067 RepID=UPI000E5D9BDE|nr:MATE family efflux transporter [Algihabitans albus]